MTCPLWVISGHCGAISDVRFTPESGHALVSVSMSAKCQKRTSLPGGWTGPLEAEIAQGWVIVRTAAQGPAVLTFFFGDRQVVDAGYSPLH